MQPISSKPLHQLARGKRSAVILISDSSRLCPSYLFLPLLLRELNAGGIPDRHIRIIVALGMHRKQTVEELIRLTGEEVYRRVEVANHSALPEDCIRMGITSRGTPIEVNRLVAEADLRIATGNIEPHALVGISGGVKALIPGAASRTCIEHNHAMSQTFKAVPGDPDNPIHQDLEEALQFVPIHFLFNVIVNHRREPLDAVAGHVIEAHREGVRKAKDRFVVPVGKTYNLVIASSGGHPKDTQLYQTVKTLKNAAAVAKPGGKIVLVAQCEELFGNGTFQYWVETIQDREVMVKKLKEQFVLGAHKVVHIDEVLKKHEVYLFSAIPRPIVELIGFRPVTDLQDTVDALAAEAGPDIAVMPYGGITFPYVMQPTGG
jgi:nickel-dependent lactate racemase